MVTRPPGADGALRLVVNAARKAVDYRADRRASARAAVRLTPLDDAALIALQGPLAAATLAGSRPARASTTMAFMSARSPRASAMFETFVSRSGYTGEDGYEISLPAAHADAFARRLLGQPGRSRRSASARAIRCGSRRASASTAMSSTRPSIRSKRRSPGRSRSAGAPRAAFPARSASCGRFAKGRLACAWA